MNDDGIKITEGR